MNAFDFLTAINQTKEDLFKDPQAVKDYNSFIVNRGLSYFPDTIIYVNEMNKYNQLDFDMQFTFLNSAITKKKRFSKWHKKDKSTDVLNAIKEMYKYSDAKASEVLDILTPEQHNIILNKVNKGGRNV